MSDTVKRICSRCQLKQATLTVMTQYKVTVAGDTMIFSEYIETTFNVCGDHIEDLRRDALSRQEALVDYTMKIESVRKSSPLDIRVRWLADDCETVLDVMDIGLIEGGALT